MKRFTIIFMFLWLAIIDTSAQNNRYDLNSDGKVNIGDITLLVSYILSKDSSFTQGKATSLEGLFDVNLDGKVNIADVIWLVNYILGKPIEDDNPNDVPAEAIDLGLPSGTKWASYNVGATKPEEYGGYYAWGETEEKETYTYENYIHCDGSYSNCHDLGEISGTEYDVAYVKWGGDWRMPTHDEQLELLDNCKSEWTTLNGVKGCKFTSKYNGKSVFFPASGYKWHDELTRVGEDCNYWSSTPVSSRPSGSYYFSFYLGKPTWGYLGCSRNYGNCVRPVTRR